MPRLVSIKQASRWASQHLNTTITISNISYLTQYGKIKRRQMGNSAYVDLDELEEYYQNNHKTREAAWKKELGEDLNWDLSFDNVKEKERTKHVHRLHPYKGKFIPQLVEYFIDSHTDRFKKEVFFNPGDIILDPFCGSGTTLVQANELGIHSVGIDISEFNCLISRCKIQKYDIEKVKKAAHFLIERLENKYPLVSASPDDGLGYQADEKLSYFVDELYTKMNEFNHQYFPNSEYKYKVARGAINEEKYSQEKEAEFLKIYQSLVKKYNVKPYTRGGDDFLEKWYMDNIRREMNFIRNYIDRGRDKTVVDLLKIVLSRTIRSCRATTHSDLARLKAPQTTPYYCYKHRKVCIPLYSLKDKFQKYAMDTLNRIRKFDQLRRDAEVSVIMEDSRQVNIFEEVKNQNEKLYDILKKQKIRGVFTSPPYVGQIDYHEQHAYAYELFDFKRRDDSEIGPLFQGKGPEARKSYVKGISEVLRNCKKYLAGNYDILLVANDKLNLYPQIVENADMEIAKRYKRPVLNRTSRDRNPYSEVIFHIKEK